MIGQTVSHYEIIILCAKLCTSHNTHYPKSVCTPRFHQKRRFHVLAVQNGSAEAGRST